ncbi:MAG: hypothetical protein LBO02_02705, partial [Holosporaceae bacterium]|nr:hypothetical protein [Holosporaceae bacterium]
FDRVFESDWPEESRDAAIPFVRVMIAFYQTYMQQIPDGLLKEELISTIKHLKIIKSHFKYITDPDDVEQTFRKEQYL